MEDPDVVMNASWVILGSPHTSGDHVMVLASDSLTTAQLTAIYRTYERDPWDPFRPDTLDKILLSTEMKTYRMAIGATYAEAMSRLFDSWNPDDKPGATPISAGQKAIAP